MDSTLAVRWLFITVVDEGRRKLDFDMARTRVPTVSEDFSSSCLMSSFPSRLCKMIRCSNVKSRKADHRDENTYPPLLLLLFARRYVIYALALEGIHHIDLIRHALIHVFAENEEEKQQKKAQEDNDTTALDCRCRSIRALERDSGACSNESLPRPTRDSCSGFEVWASER